MAQVASVPVDTSVLADALQGRFDSAAAAAHVRLTVELPETPQPLGDPERLLQAVSALVSNAITYTPEGGEVRVSAREVRGRWRLRVDDSGPGIPAEKREEVFGRFSRLEGSDSAGTGLGLSICQRLVSMMGGTVSASESDLGGARVEIDLPLAGR